MNFRRQRRDEEPEINLVPMIDILLVVLIFLMVTTTFVKPAALRIKLPGSQNAQTQQNDKTTSLVIRVSADGMYALEGQPRALTLTELKSQIRSRAEGIKDARNTLTILIEADRNASHQQVVDALDSVAQAGLNRVSIITQKR